MKVEVEVNEVRIKELVDQILAVEKAYTLVYPYLSTGGPILRGLDVHKTELRGKFQSEMWEYSNYLTVAIDVFNSLSGTVKEEEVS